jgi:hypothetical protein
VRLLLLSLFPTDTRGLEPVRYGGVLLSAPLHASETLHNLLNVPENKQTPRPEYASEQYRPTERPPHVGEVIANFCG